MTLGIHSTGREDLLGGALCDPGEGILRVAKTYVEVHLVTLGRHSTGREDLLEGALGDPGEDVVHGIAPVFRIGLWKI